MPHFVWSTRAIRLADVNLAIVEKCHDPERGTTIFFSWEYVEMVHGLQLSVLSETGNVWLLSSGTATL
jgi:hypothetical protein